MIKTWQQRCEEHPDHEGVVSNQMIMERMQEEIDELRQALAQLKDAIRTNPPSLQLDKAAEMALEALECAYRGKDRAGQVIDAIVALEKALAQHVDNVYMSEERVHKTEKSIHEPVAWMHNFIEGIAITHKPVDIGRHPERWTALYKDPTPCKTCQSLAMTVMNDQTYHEKVIQKREWVGLTDEERSYYLQAAANVGWWQAALFVERALKERNGG